MWKACDRCIEPPLFGRKQMFAFLRDVKLDGKPAYFELGPDPKPAPYDRDVVLKDAKECPLPGRAEEDHAQKTN